MTEAVTVNPDDLFQYVLLPPSLWEHFKATTGKDLPEGIDPKFGVYIEQAKLRYVKIGKIPFGREDVYVRQ